MTRATATHCAQGHPWSADTIWYSLRPDGTRRGRECRICRTLAMRRLTAKRQQARKEART